MKDLVNLQQAIYKTIENIELWQEVLQLFCEVTGAKKGTITLRDRKSAELVIPNDVESDLSSPLLYGFSDEEIGGYITHYIQFDPWTKFERLYHPNKPIALSKYVKYEEITATPFWEWLEPQQINDTVVLDIGTSHPNWIAMNLYFDGCDAAMKRKIIRYTAKLQKTMQEVWALGQKVRAAQLEPSRLGYFLNQQPYASMLLSPDGKIILTNSKADRLLQAEGSQLKRVDDELVILNKTLKKKYAKAMQGFKVMSGTSFEEKIELSVDDLSFCLTLIEKAEDQIGVDKAARLLIIKNLSASVRCIWENPNLTKRERQLIEVLAEGGRVVDFMHAWDLSKSTSHFHWANVKKKLKIQDRAEVVALHKLYLSEIE